MATPLAQWLFTEASSGVVPTSVADTASGTAVPLVPAYQGATAWGTTGAGKGLVLAGTNSNATSATLGTNKIQSGLNGSKTMTWELVIDFGSTGAGGATVADVLDGTSAQVCGLYSTGSGAGWQVWSDFADATQNFSLSKPSAGVHVVHIVFDSAQATAANRVKVYFDGVAQTLTAGTTIPQNRTLVVTSTSRATIGSFPGDNFSWSGGIYYAALYTAALSSTEVTANATALAANNDADPNATTVVVDQVPLDAALTVSRPRSAAAKRYDVVAPIGALIVAGLSSVGWGPATALPALRSLRATNAPVLQPVQPTGTGTFSLAKFPHSSTGTFGAQPRSRVVDGSAPVGALIQASTLTSLGWLQIGTSAPNPAPRLVFSDVAGPQFQAAALTSLGWLACDPLPRKASVAAFAPLPVGPESPLVPFVSLSTGWFSYPQALLPQRALVPARPEASAPVGAAFSGQGLTSLGWLAPELARAAVSRPARPAPAQSHLKTALAFGGTPWDSAPADRRAPATPAVAPSAPVGTAFALALPSNGWLATDNPRTPLALGKSTPTDAVGNLLVLPPLPSLAWLATENPRTKLTLQGSVTVDPVGPKMALPGALGPYWHADLPARAAAPSARVAPTDPIGSTAATLAAIGWLSSPFEAPRSPIARQRPQSVDPLSALQFGGTPWATVDIQPGKAASARLPSESAPVGSLLGPSLSSLGWLTTEGTRARLVSLQPGPSAPVGTFIPPPVLPSMGFQSFVELPPKWKFVARPVPSEPVGSSFALGFSVAPSRRCSPLFDLASSGRLSPVFDETK